HRILEQQVDRFQPARLALVREVEKAADGGAVWILRQRRADEQFLGALALPRFAAAGGAGIGGTRRIGQAAAPRAAPHRIPVLPGGRAVGRSGGLGGGRPRGTPLSGSRSCEWPKPIFTPPTPKSASAPREVSHSRWFRWLATSAGLCAYSSVLFPFTRSANRAASALTLSPFGGNSATSTTR